MRFSALFGVLALTWVGCGVEKGPSSCEEAATAECNCDNGAVGLQTCAGGLFQPCVCTPSGGSGGFAGFVGTGGCGGAGATDAGGNGGTSGTGGVGMDAGGTGGVGADAGGTGGGGGTGDTGGTGAIDGGTSTAALAWARCDVDLGSAACVDALVCFRAGGSTTGSGFCTNACAGDGDCKKIDGVTPVPACGSESLCRFTCMPFGPCPLGMTCDFLTSRCNYPN